MIERNLCAIEIDLCMIERDLCPIETVSCTIELEIFTMNVLFCIKSRMHGENLAKVEISTFVRMPLRKRN